MDVDALLEMLGIRPRPAEAKLGPDGVYQQPEAEREAQREDYRARIANPAPEPPSDLMEILNRNRTDPDVHREAQTLLRPRREAHNEEVARITRNRDEAAHDARRAELALGNNGMTPLPQDRIPGNVPAAPQYAHLDRAGPGFAGVQTPSPAPAPAPESDPAAIEALLASIMPPPAPAPRPSAPAPTPAGPSAPQYAHLDRGGGPFVSASQAQPVPIEGPAPPTMTPAIMAQLQAAEGPQNPIVNSGAFQTLPPLNPFENDQGYAPGPPGVPIPRPAPSPNWRPSGPLTPFTAPSASPRQQAEGMPILTPPAVLQASAAPRTPQAFAPQGELMDWWNRTPQPAAMGGPARAPTPPPSAAPAGPDMATLLNQQELARFLAANGGGTPAPAAPSAPAPQPMMSANAPTPGPAPAGATPMSPAPAPRPNEPVPQAMKEQLLQEAYRIVASRGAQPQGMAR